jgi:hypothetical protein
VDIALSGGSTGNSTATFTDTITGLRRVSFALNPAQYTPNPGQQCNFFASILPPVNVTLDNTGSNVDVGWKVTITDKDGPGSVWATAKPTSGTIPAGKTAQITITPANDVCGKPIPQSFAASYHAIVTLTTGGTGSFTFTYNVTYGS